MNSAYSLSKLSPQQLNLLEVAAFDKEIAYLYKLEIARIKCMFTHSNVSLTISERLSLPTSNEVQEFQQNLESKSLALNSNIAKPHSECVCGLKFLSLESIASGFSTEQVFQAAAARFQSTLSRLK